MLLPSEKITALSAEEAKKLLTICTTPIAEEDEAKCVYFGLFREGELKAAMAWGAPCTSELKASYTVELKSFAATDRSEQSDFLKLLDYYRSHFRPSDMIYHNELAPPKASGFSRERDDKASCYSWHDEKQNFYTYRITATNSQKYYIGVRRIFQAKATPEDCLSDGYWGSGGKNPHNKFKAWKRKHSGELQKEILSIHEKRSEAFQEERRLIGDSWKGDQLCLNSRPGGAMSPPSFLEANLRGACPHHGTVGYIGGACRSCILEKQETQALCDLHGEVSHFAGHCRICLHAKSLHLHECRSHGTTIFQKNTCLKCKAATKVSLLPCTIHGITKHNGNSCGLCASSKVFSQKSCSTHGMTSFVGTKCSKCLHAKAVALQECSIHGVTKHRGASCFKCARAKTFTTQNCTIHGTTTFQGTHCMRCLRGKAKAAREQR